jgi:serine/threonine-protein kinase RsbW
MPPVPEPALRPDSLRLVLQADPDAVRAGLKRILALPPLSGLPPNGRSTAELVLAEVLNNVVEHAYASADHSGSITITLSAGAAGVDCLIVDQGLAMPGGVLPQGRLPGGPDTALQDLPEGGFGWHLIRTLTLDLTYVRNGGDNRLSLTLPHNG